MWLMVYSNKPRTHTNQQMHQRVTFETELSKHVQAAIIRRREKRSRPVRKKKVMYKCRHDFAVGRPRVGGRFVACGVATRTRSRKWKRKGRKRRRSTIHKRKPKAINTPILPDNVVFVVPENTYVAAGAFAAIPLLPLFRLESW